jgi:FtsP/CotA-like multicopper oxidase with cupredoxin domain
MKENNFASKQFIFNTGAQHTINDLQFNNGHAHVSVLLSATEEWTIKNMAASIDHPLHIHINPFQVSEFFDPNENLVDPITGKLEIGNSAAVPRYIFTGQPKVDPRQCELDPNDPTTWREGGKVQEGACKKATGTDLVWRDVFAIPSSRNDGGPTIPGYFKMRSRFVDYPGLYVMHCHILIHEDRGMMFSVEVVRRKATTVRHH